MNLLLILTLFINYLCINGGPVPETTIYDVIKQSAKDPKLNCTEVRSTLVEPQKAFLTKCSYNVAINVDANKTDSDDLCLLYYLNVMNLCKISTDIPQLNLSTKLIEDERNPQGLPNVCGTILKETKSFVYDQVTESVALTLKKLNSKHCAVLCLTEDYQVKHECSLNAFMLKTALSLNTKFSKPRHTEKAVQDTQETHPEIQEQVMKKDAKLEDIAVQSNNANVNPDTDKPKSISVEKVEILPLKTEIKVEENVEEPKVNPEETPPVVNSHIEPLKPLEANVVNEDTGKVDVGKVDLQKESLQPVSSVIVSKNPVPDSPAVENSIVDEQNTNLDKKDKTKEITENISVEKVAPNAQQVDLGKTTIKVIDDKKLEAKNGGVPEDDISILEDDKQVTNNKNEVAKPIPQKNTFDNNDNNLDKENPDFDGNGDELRSPINDPEDYGEAPDSPLDNPGVSEILSGNSAAVANDKPKSSEVKTKIPEKLNNKPQETKEDEEGLPANYQNQSIDDSDSYFFSYFMMVCIMFICGYVAYHNKQKILALVVEGRRGRRTSRSRRPNSANYRKLDSNLEEAVTSSCNKNTTQIIY